MTAPKNPLEAPGPIPIEPVPPAGDVEPARETEPPMAERLAREVRRLDQVLVGVVLVLAFFLGSFVATNTDLWLHLAAGRLVTQGRFEFGSDPFAYTTAGVRWVNHGWLADTLAYGLSAALGGPDTPLGGGALVFAKALLVTLLAVVLLACCRPAPSMWVPAVLVAVALVAMMPRLLLQSRCFSFLFLGLTLYLLLRPRRAGFDWPRRVCLPALFALWVNLDAWFILGPLTVALFLLAEGVHLFLAPEEADRSALPRVEARSLGWALGLGLAACLLNPYHVYAFQLPTELWAKLYGAALKTDPQLAAVVASPLRTAYVLRDGRLIPAGLAFYLLLGLGLASFYYVRERWPWWRGVVWLAFAALALWLERAVPFFAVAGCVVAALNGQDFLARRFGPLLWADPRRRQLALVGRLATTAGGVVLAALAWPGWLQPEGGRTRLGYSSRRVDWGVWVDPSLEGAARELARLRERNVIPAAMRGFPFTPDVANYCAWFCPSEKGYFDYRFALFADVLPTYLNLREALVARPDGGVHQDTEWPQLFREEGIDHVVVGGAERDWLYVLPRFWGQPDRWVMLYGDGRTTVFGWKDPRDPAAARALEQQAFNFNALAFGPNLPEPDRAPDTAPPPPERRPWWTEYARGGRPRPLAADASRMDLLYYETTAQRWDADADRLSQPLLFLRYAAAWAGPASAAPTGGALVSAFFTLNWVARSPDQVALFEGVRKSRDRGPPAAALLAVRAGRRAVAANPDDPDAYRTLGFAYVQLWATLERFWLSGPSPLLHQIRTVQAVTALQNVLALRPDDPEVHLELARLYQQMDVAVFLLRDTPGAPHVPFIDWELEHRRSLREQKRAARERARQEPGESFDQFQQRKEFLERDAANAEREVTEAERRYDFQRRRNAYEVAAGNKKPLEKARLALQHGLVKEARDVLDDLENYAQLDSAGIDLLLRLYLVTGEGYRVVETGQAFADPWDSILLAAALGDYRKAELYLEQMGRTLEQVSVRQALAAVQAQTFADVSPQGLHQLMVGLARLADRADFEALRALLALETGDTERAAGSFRQAQRVSAVPAYPALALAPLGAGDALEAAVTFSAMERQPIRASVPFALQGLAARYLSLLRAAGTRPAETPQRPPASEAVGRPSPDAAPAPAAAGLQSP
jgi:hypothetical protein